MAFPSAHDHTSGQPGLREVLSRNFDRSPNRRRSVDRHVFTDERYFGGVQELPILPPGGGCNVQHVAIYQHLALCCVQAKWRRNLDSLAGCSIISSHVLYSRPSCFEQGGLRFTGPLTPMSPRCDNFGENENGRCPGISRSSARFLEESFDCILGWCYLHLWIDYAQIIPQPGEQGCHGQDDQNVSEPDAVMTK